MKHGFRLFKQKRPPKKGVMIAVPSLTGEVTSSIAMRLDVAGMLSAHPDHPYYYVPYMPQQMSPVEAARNNCVRFFMEQSTCEYLYFWDADQCPPDNWFDLIRPDLDIVSGITWMWCYEKAPMQRLQFNQFRLRPGQSNETVIPTEFITPYEVDMVGTACMVIPRRVFERLGVHPFMTDYRSDGSRESGEDLKFCRMAKTSGFSITIVPSVVFGHWKMIDLKSVYETVCAMTQVAYETGVKVGKGELPGQSVMVPTPAEQIEEAPLSYVGAR